MYFLRRIGFFLLTLWGAVTLNFFIPRISGGDPAAVMAQKIAGKGEQVTPAQIDAIRAMIGAPDIPIWEQYVQYLGNTVRGDFGVSMSYFPYTVTHMIGEAMWWTIVLVGVTLILSFIIGTLFGTWVAWRRGTTFDTVMTVGASFIGTLPFFWIALLLIWGLSYTLGWFPASGGYSGFFEPGFTPEFIGDAAHHFALPALALLITGPIGWMLGMRNNMVQSLGEDHSRFGRAKGLSGRTLAIHYGARVAILPNVTGLAMALGAMIGGTVLVEQIFQYPGMGRLLFDAVGNHDYALSQAVFLFIAIGVLVANLLADMLYGILDPRARRKEAS
ncbi:ABC transporter permease [Microbacterium sp. BK668]|uniref:ABC transporter permease n=1 Tax=Microbacterium sp. BK668 TaxID=2512118 RepID=UPI00105E67DD|nr:ABC transporter permease [Microbacterium sp. BK668]TDN91458.1 peptide/nickel transport system permease protein [Microbacterium sp. BK668]